MEYKKEIISNTINFLRFPLIVLVVCMHFSGGEALLYHRIMNFGLKYFSVAVPIFFAISGYLFGNCSDFSQYKKKLTKSVHTLVIPYILWNLLFIAFYCVLHKSFTFENLYGLVNMNAKSFIDFILSVITGKGMPANYPLWFLRDLIVCYLFAPLLYLMNKQTPWLTLFALFVGWILTENSSGRSYFTGLCWFSIGMTVKLHDIDITKLKNIVVPLCLLSLILALYNPVVLLSWPIPYKFYHVFLTIHILATLSFAFYITTSTKIQSDKFLSNSSFWIFASHAFIQIALIKIEKYVDIPMTDTSMFLMFVFNVVLTITISLIVFIVAKKYFPRTIALLTGNRS